ncbi:MAG: GNAT family acetyltransferase [Planctomycetota bacterium]
MEIRPYRPADEAEVIELWRQCDLLVPWNDPNADIARKAGYQPDLFLVVEEEGRVAAVVMAGYEGRRGWINYLGVLPECQGRGVGRRIMEEAERRLRALGCPKINVQIRDENRDVVAFYEHLGYATEALVSMGKRITRRPPS